MLKVKLAQTPFQINDFDSVFNYLIDNIKSLEETADNTPNLLLLPELYLNGYPLNDIVLQKDYIVSYQKLLDQINNYLKNNPLKKTHVLMGAVKYELDQEQLPKKIYNSIAYIGTNVSSIEFVYHKQLLPNYDIFDEKKYFSASNESNILKIENYNLGLLICEDMWFSSVHEHNPVKSLLDLVNEQKVNLDGVINLSASPFYTGKHINRINRSKEISKLFDCPFFYVNKVGGEDEILFDGQSFVLEKDEVLFQANLFTAQEYIFNLEKNSKIFNQIDFENSICGNSKNTYEDLFQSRICPNSKKLRPLSNLDCNEILNAIIFGLQEYAKKSGFNKFTIAMSGGIDSAITLAITKILTLKDPNFSVEAIYMPGQFSSNLSYDLSIEMCQNIGVKLFVAPIKFLHSASSNLLKQTFNEEVIGLTDENIQSRIRGFLLMARTNQSNSIAINTSNKSEISVGYSTLYGDSVGAISLIGDLYKTQVYTLANYINSHYQNMIPQNIITREPSAELRENQLDKNSLPEYEILDTILEGLLSYRYSVDDLLKLDFSMDLINKVKRLVHLAEYKRKQFCPIIKLQTKSFGHGHRVPITKKLL